MKWFDRILSKALIRILALYEGATYKFGRPIIPGAYQGSRFDASASSRAEMARKMRAFERDECLVQALAGKFENFVVGACPEISPISSDQEWNKRAKAWWDEWTDVCDLTSRQSFATVMQLAARRWFVEGDVFILLTRGDERLGSRPRIQLVESHLCRTPPQFEKDPLVHDGVRMDRNGRPIAYYFAEEDNGGQSENIRSSQNFTYPPPKDADFVIPIFEPERPGEVRGITHFHAAIREIEGLKLLHEFEMQAAADNASTMTWIKTKTGELDPDTVRRAIMAQSGVTNAGTATTEVNKPDYYREASGGRARLLMQGDEVSQNAGERPSVTSTGYWRLKTEWVCANVEIPYCIVFPDSMQGTVYRGALDMAATAFKSRHQVIATAERRIWQYVIGWAIKNDIRLADPPPDWKNVSILPPRAPNVDVGRNATAEKEALSDGRTNYDQIYGPLGLSWETEIKKLEKQLTVIEKDCPHVWEMLQAARGTGAQQVPIAGQQTDQGVAND